MHYFDSGTEISMDTMKTVRTLLFAVAIVLTVVSLAISATRFEVINRSTGLAKWIYAAPAAIGLLIIFAALYLDEYLKVENARTAFLATVGSLAITGFIILIGLLLRG